MGFEIEEGSHLHEPTRQPTMTRRLRALWTVLACGLMLAGLGGCVTPDISPQFLALRPRAESNPAPGAIVGMWSKRGGRNAPESSMSLLFRGDGTGMQKELRFINHDAGFSSIGLEKQDIDPVRFTYQYNGDGSWSDSLGGRMWLADGFLLREATTYVTGDRLSSTVGDFVPTKHAFTRVE